ncbi:MAG: undecaprenyl-diphosphate phosphatase [Gemmatimonadetes bacterium]|nr:undecaprenyl-diphosphate phosphatase [Gemmatimonadota bacterium]
MSLPDAIVLGIVQGLTEFLPVSSSGHLVMAEFVLNAPTPGVLVAVVLHAATLLSVLIVYRHQLARLVWGAIRRQPEAWAYVGLLALATLPAVVVALLFEKSIERAFDTPAVTGAMLLVTGVILWSTRFTPRDRLRHWPTWRLAFLIGVAQAAAILPGISRAGATISAGLWGRLSGERAAEFSFLMAIPAIAGAVVFELPDLRGSIAGSGGAALLAGFTAACAFGIIAIRGLVWLIRRQDLRAFAYYVWAVGALFLTYLASRG